MDAPGPLHRRGPRPLHLHLMLSQLSNGGSPSWNGASMPPWLFQGPAASQPRGGAAPGNADAALVAGIAAYRRHPYRRTLPDPPAIWAEGPARLLDHRPDREDGGPAVLVVPSLVNRAYVLDLAPGQSLLRWLAAQGRRALLLDWGWPGPEERRFTLTDHVAGRLAAAVAAAVAATGRPVVLAGYCMGGLLALALAQLRPDLVRGLALLATPWDFHAPAAGPALRLLATLPWLDPVLTATGTLPIDTMQAMFALLDPGQVPAKYRAFARLPPASPAARRFVALEDWLNDGVPLPAPVARECIAGWYGANSTMAGTWRVAGQPIDPTRLRVPTFVAVPDRDRIVPAESAQVLGGLIPRAVLHRPRAGHIGMVAGSRAEAELWRPLLGWLHGLPASI